MTTAAFILGFSSIFTGLNFIVTIHKLRVKGMGWYDMPLLLWALYATSVLQVLATPVVGVTLLLLIMERTHMIGVLKALGEMPWQAYTKTIRKYEQGEPPLKRLMITPANLARAEELELFFKQNY